jgi:flagellar hook assembly protein FlgD
VAVLHAGSLAAGRRTLSWDGRSADGAPAPSGVYRAVLRTATAASATTITLLK